ncbi:hypothetical protein D8674_009256 [Pyrus ussuriensis x Pyrus communis]|uniref:Uncharacterized protein n=1 Tax=Pyrus ussuriensis x Pyrus communis TaxID=2448454 RepID=A0A5N5HY12_9ROSA|nr:hypothetical protein D8674_009256 [Pyrus ussuriensis x Pyrus communis]
MVVAWLTSLVAAIIVGVVIIGLGWWRSWDGGINDGMVMMVAKVAIMEMMVLVMVIAIKDGNDSHDGDGKEATMTTAVVVVVVEEG